MSMRVLEVKLKIDQWCLHDHLIIWHYFMEDKTVHLLVQLVWVLLNGFEPKNEAMLSMCDKQDAEEKEKKYCGARNG